MAVLEAMRVQLVQILALPYSADMFFVSDSVQSICRTARTTWRRAPIGNARLVDVRFLDVPCGYTYGKVEHTQFPIWGTICMRRLF